MIDLTNIEHQTTEAPAAWSMLGNAVEIQDLPLTHRDQIRFFNEAGSKYIYDLLNASHLITGEPWDPFTKNNFKKVERLSNVGVSAESLPELKKWLFNRGIPFPGQTFVLPVFGEQPMLMTWKMVIKYADSIFRGDDVVVFDKTLSWCMYFHHDNYILFGKDHCYDSSEDEKMMSKALARQKKFPGYKPPFY